MMKDGSLTVDGIEVEYIKILDGLIGVELNEGNHNIEFKYLNLQDYYYRSIISLLAIFIIIFMEIAKKKNKYYNNKTNQLSQ